MADVIRLARPHASIKSTTDKSTTNPEAIRLHGLAENALATALHLLRQLDTTPEQLNKATARAIRAATLLKRAAQVEGGAA